MTTETTPEPPAGGEAVPQPPRPERRHVVRRHHGDAFVDPYEWLRDADDPAVLAHLEAENAYTAARTSHLAGLRERLFAEIKDRTLETDLSVPTRHGGWWYYGRTVEGSQYPIQCRSPLASPTDWTPPVLDPDVAVPGEVVLLDANAEADGHDFFALGSFDVTPDGTRMLYAADTVGDERYTVRIRDLATGTTLPDEIPGTFAGATLSPDGRFVVYTTVDEAWRPDTVWLHELGTSPDADTRLFHESDERFWVGASFTRSERYLVIEVGSSVTSEEWLVDAADLRGAPRVVWPRRDGVEYSLSHAEVDGADTLFVLHNDGARDFELVRVPTAAPQDPPQVVVPHVPGVRLLGLTTFRDGGALEYRRDGLTRVGILTYASGSVYEIPFADPLYTVGLGDNPEWAPPLLRLGYGSFVTPGTVYDYEVGTGALLLRKQQPVLGGYDPADYGERRLWAAAADGTQIPVSLVWKRSFGDPGDAPRPVHLYGYGAYEASTDPSFSIARLSELDRGVVFAVAHVRGGGEMGREWYEDGKLDHKRNSFTDFVDVARHLVAQRVTTPDRLVAEGGSAGGLLMGAVANLAPELFAGVLAAVPFVDPLTSILDPTLPLTVIEWDEWGDPLHDPAAYAYMKSYAPYENVRDGLAYPRILAVTSLHDTRVLYVEPAKWVARLRDAGADALLKCEMAAGHGGVSGRYNAWRERAYELSWLLDVLGLS
ncbi:S9 family peptidase [Propionicicella superfundia]|uniref:S9 family peptidase n=1 Tax=Propionicicella superfundia TaxID=348582 RepID=UPI00041415C8|nr:S9 family peptidase [Propionicicella superfundia]